MEDILVEVVCNLPDTESRTVSVSTPERNTVAGLIRKTCKENSIPMRSNYVLKDSRDRTLQWSQTLLHCGVKHGNILYMTQDDDSVDVAGGCHWNSWWFVAAISLLIGGIGLTAISVLFTRNGQIEYQYGIVLDAGSSHTKLFVYKWQGEKVQETAVARQVHVCPVVGPGISSYAEVGSNLIYLSGNLSVCLDQAKEHVPGSKHKTTPIFLGATAGMRMLSEVNQSASDSILRLVQTTIQNYPFSFSSPTDQARIITGQEEGTFGWVTANYVSDKVASDITVPPEETIGALDMGGASTQITFVPAKSAILPADYREDVVLYGSTYTVYSHSYLCYGINEAIRRYKAILVHSQNATSESNGTVTNPCGPKGNITMATYQDIFEAPCANQFAGNFRYLQPTGYVDKKANYTFEGTGDEEACISTVKNLFNFTAPCPYSQCTFDGTYQPNVQGDFYAFSSFFYELDFLNLTENRHVSLSKFEAELSKLCNTSWDVVKTMKAGDNGSMLGWYCFEGHFIHTLLVDAYKFNDKTFSNIQFIQKINHTDIGWTLGYMLNSSYVIPAQGPDIFISTAAFSALCVLFVIFIILSIGFGIYAKKHQKHSTLGLYQSVPTYGAV